MAVCTTVQCPRLWHCIYYTYGVYDNTCIVYIYIKRIELLLALLLLLLPLLVLLLPFIAWVNICQLWKQTGNGERMKTKQRTGTRTCFVSLNGFSDHGFVCVCRADFFSSCCCCILIFFYVCLCVCVRACVRACVYANVRVFCFLFLFIFRLPTV